ncbi:MAG TPA: protein kinase [Thermoanaerobaculia bacterium]|nr:protein kinase [Thermoanaerobaculia bacterium]
MTDTGTSRLRSLSLATRIFLVTSLLVTVAVGAAAAVTFWLVQKTARRAADEALESSSSVQSAFQTERYKRLELITRLFAADPAVAAYLGERDTRSILDLLTERGKDLGFDFAIFVDPAGKVIARTDRPQAVGQDLSQRSLLQRAIANLTEAAGVWQEEGNLYYAVAQPLSKDTLLGFLVTGFAINDLSALEVNKISGADVAFVSEAGGQPQVVASTLPRQTSDSLISALRAENQKKMMDTVVIDGKVVPRADLQVKGEPWIAFLAPLLDAAGKPVGFSVALASLEKESAAYREIETALVVAGIISILLASLLSFALARGTLAPVRRLVAAAEAARQGDYDQKVATDSGDEVGRLGRAFEDLLSDLREKRDMEAYVTELSKSLPEPRDGRAALGHPSARDVLLMGIELRGFGVLRADSGPGPVLDRFASELARVAAAVTGARGQLESIFGHQVLARFEGDKRALRALAAAAEILKTAVDDPDAPLVALASGRIAVGPVPFGEQSERAVVGGPVAQLESLAREATSGEVVLSREVYEELKGSFEQAGYQLAPRRGLVSPQLLYVLSSTMAQRVTGGRVAVSTPQGKTAEAVATLSNIEPGALMARRFEILSILGAGGMGVVYKARDRELDDLVALKMLKRELWGDLAQLERLKSEIRLARKITHPNVLRTFDFGEIDGVPYISMEYVRGVTLRYLLDQTHRLPYSAGLRLGKQLCAGLGAAHAVGVMHRDIKPENLILTPTGNAKLMDFGIARPIERLTPGQTQVGFIVGTPQYLSPEQLQGREVDARADIYSCGIVLYEIFTGELPFSAPSAMEIMLKHLQEPPVPPRVHWPEIPERLERIILRCLEKEPAARYPTVDALHRDLETLSA